MPHSPAISVVIPVYNEADYLEEAVADLRRQLATIPAEVTILLAENGSTDATPTLARRLADDWDRLSWMHIDTADYGAAMRDGFLATAGRWVVNFDIDYYSIDFLSQVLAADDATHVILGSKRAPGSQDRRSRFRRTATWAFNVVLRALLGSGVSDTHGIKAIRREVVDELAPLVVSRQDLFDTELVIRAERAGYRITEVPVVVQELRETRSSLLMRVPRTLRGIWRIRRQLASERS